MRKAPVQRPRISGRHRSHHRKTGYTPMPSPCLADVAASPTPRLSIQAPMKRVGLSNGKILEPPILGSDEWETRKTPIPLPIRQIRQHVGGIRMPIGRAANRMGRCSSQGCRPDAQHTLRLRQVRDGISARRQDQRLVGAQFHQHISNRPFIRLDPRAFQSKRRTNAHIRQMVSNAPKAIAPRRPFPCNAFTAKPSRPTGIHLMPAVSAATREPLASNVLRRRPSRRLPASKISSRSPNDTCPLVMHMSLPYRMSPSNACAASGKWRSVQPLLRQTSR